MSQSLNILLTLSGASSVLNGLDAARGAITSLAPSAFSATAALATLNKGLDLGGRFSDLSARTGQSVRDLVVMERAFDAAGVGAQATAPMIGLLQKAIAGLNEEGESTAKTWARLNLSPDALRPLSSVEQLRALTTSFAGIKDPAERAAIAMQLFGRNGAQMLQLLSDSQAISSAEEEVGRLGDRLQTNAARFDALGDRLAVAKARLAEFQVVAAEKAIPVLERMAELIGKFNPATTVSALSTGISVFGLVSGAKLVEKLDEKVLDWATRQGNPIGQAFALRFLAPLTGALAKVLPMGLAAAVATAVMVGIYDGYNQWKNDRLDAASNSFDRVAGINQKAQAIRSPEDRDKVIAEARALSKKISDDITAEADKGWLSDKSVLASYEQQQSQLRGTVRLLMSDWAQARIEANKAADELAEIQKREASAVAWLKDEEGEKARARALAGIEEESSIEERLNKAKSSLSLYDSILASGRAIAKEEGKTAQAQQMITMGLAGRYQALESIAKIQEELDQKRDQELSRKGAAAQEGMSRIEQSKFFTSEQKDRMRSTILQKHNEVIRERIALLEKEQAASPDPTRQGQIDSLRREHGSNAAEIDALKPLSTGQGAIAGMVSYLDSIPTAAERAQQAVMGIAQAMENGIATSLEGLINQTMTWGEALANIGTSIVQAIIQAFVRMAAQWIVQQIIMAVFGKAIQAAQLAALAPIAMATAALWAPAATAASIATFGGAAVEGAAMAQTAIWTSALGLAEGGAVRGPGTSTSDSIPVWLSNGEHVINAATVQRFGGHAFFDELRAGRVPQLAASSPAAASGGGSGAGERGLSMHQALYFDREEAMRSALTSPAGRRQMVDIVRGVMAEL